MDKKTKIIVEYLLKQKKSVRAWDLVCALEPQGIGPNAVDIAERETWITRIKGGPGGESRYTYNPQITPEKIYTMDRAELNVAAFQLGCANSTAYLMEEARKAEKRGDHDTAHLFICMSERWDLLGEQADLLELLFEAPRR